MAKVSELGKIVSLVEELLVEEAVLVKETGVEEALSCSTSEVDATISAFIIFSIKISCPFVRESETIIFVGFVPSSNFPVKCPQ